jgi:nitronate monooxygenase
MSILAKKLDDYRFELSGKSYVPIIQGGMGVDISTRRLAQVVASLGGIGTISDAMVQTVIDKDFKTRYVANKLKKYKYNVSNNNKSEVKFDLDEIYEAQSRHVKESMAGKTGPGSIFINIMEKLTMNNPKETLKARLNAALDAGIDGITLSAGLHLGSFDLMQDNARFREASLGVIVSSVRALNLFLKRVMRLDRLPDFVVVEGPLAGGHLGFGMDWGKYDLMTITREVIDFLKEKSMNIPVIPAGGIFTGTDAVKFMESGAAAVQVATRFLLAKECGVPDKVKQEYIKAEEDQIEVNTVSTTGYPMRMLNTSPAIGSGIRPNCESYGYLLDSSGNCSYIEAYNNALESKADDEKLSVREKTCLCTHMRKFNVWTCGQETWRLKDTTLQNPDGSYQLLDAEHIFKDYQFSTNNEIKLPDPE